MLPIRCAGTASCGPVGSGLETVNFIFIFKKDEFFFVWLYLFPAELVPCSEVQVWQVTEEGGIIGCGGAFG